MYVQFRTDQCGSSNVLKSMRSPCKARKFIVSYNMTIYLQWHIAGILMHQLVLKHSPHEIHIFDHMIIDFDEKY